MMSECAGSCGIVSQRQIVSRQPNLMDTLAENYKHRRMLKQERRENELVQKGRDSGLNTAEAIELTGYKIQNGLNALARLNADSICYMA